ncbi:protein kinase [Saccharothrix sp. S26]|uniref:protein kinase domain-containing protein n=1 Tax=Saccharothrix sp. S26 TaxID=2907215 RepID=UPI0035AB900A
MVGTAAYLAPEQVRGTGVDHSADIYALGLVLLECLTGHCEYTGSEVEAAVARLHRSPAVPAHLPPDLANLLTAMTASDPDQRPTAADCARALQANPAENTLPIPARIPPTAPAETPQTAPAPRKALLASAAALLSAISVAWAITPAAQPANSAPARPRPRPPRPPARRPRSPPHRYRARQRCTSSPPLTPAPIPPPPRKSSGNRSTPLRNRSQPRKGAWYEEAEGQPARQKQEVSENRTELLCRPLAHRRCHRGHRLRGIEPTPGNGVRGRR